MSSIFFLIPFLAIVSIGLYQDSYADETIIGEIYNDILNPDGTRTFITHHPYILDNGIYVPYIQNGLSVNSKIGNVILNADGSYTWNGKFTDKIIGKYSDISDQVNWTYPNLLNNDTPDVSFSNNEFHSNKVRAGVADMDYKYVFKNGQWKTELVVTNLSGLTTKVFGFDQIIDLNSDTIKFGGIVRNLDNFDGVTFDKTFLENNEGKILDLLNGVNFDFDLGFENLYSITVYDTGVNSSQLVFDYRTSDILLPGETLVIDPTFTSTPTSDGRSYSGNAGGATCPAFATGDTSFIYIINEASGTAGSCQTAWFNFDVSSIDNDAIVSAASLEYDILATGSMINCDWKHLDFTAAADAATYDALQSDVGAVTDILQNDAGCTAGVGDGNLATFDTGGYAALIEGDITGDDVVSLGGFTTVQTRDATQHYIQIRLADAVLSVTYSVPPVPDAVDDLSSPSQTFGSVDLIWTEPDLNTGTLTGYQINYTTPWGDPNTIITNNTESSTTSTTVSNLEISTDYSFRIGVWTESYNMTGNILNVTTQGNFTIGSSVFNQTNTQVLPITFEQQVINDTAKFLNVTFANTYDLACDFHYKFANTNQTYTNLTSYAVSTTLDETSFEFVDYDNEVIDVYCWDVNSGTDATYLLVQSDFPLLQQIQNFRDGEYGTDGNFGVFDFVTLLVVIISMIGLNRLNESVGAIFNIIFLGSLAYFGIIELPTIIFGALAVVLVFVITSTRKP